MANSKRYKRQKPKKQLESKMQKGGRTKPKRVETSIGNVNIKTPSPIKPITEVNNNNDSVIDILNIKPITDEVLTGGSRTFAWEGCDSFTDICITFRQDTTDCTKYYLDIDTNVSVYALEILFDNIQFSTASTQCYINSSIWQGTPSTTSCNPGGNHLKIFDIMNTAYIPAGYHEGVVIFHKSDNQCYQNICLDFSFPGYGQEVNPDTNPIFSSAAGTLLKASAVGICDNNNYSFCGCTIFGSETGEACNQYNLWYCHNESMCQVPDGDGCECDCERDNNGICIPGSGFMRIIEGYCSCDLSDSAEPPWFACGCPWEYGIESNYDPDNYLDWPTIDCEGTCNGTAIEDQCGTCNGPGICDSFDGEGGMPEGYNPDYMFQCRCNCNWPAEKYDCKGNCNGNAEFDYNGICCDNIRLDQCLICDGPGEPNSGVCDCASQPYGDGIEDCFGECNGNAILDQWGDCCYEEDKDYCGKCYGGGVENADCGCEPGEWWMAAGENSFGPYDGYCWSGEFDFDLDLGFDIEPGTDPEDLEISELTSAKFTCVPSGQCTSPHILTLPFHVCLNRVRNGDYEDQATGMDFVNVTEAHLFSRYYGMVEVTDPEEKKNCWLQPDDFLRWGRNFRNYQTTYDGVPFSEASDEDVINSIAYEYCGPGIEQQYTFNQVCDVREACSTPENNGHWACYKMNQQRKSVGGDPNRVCPIGYDSCYVQNSGCTVGGIDCIEPLVLGEGNLTDNFAGVVKVGEGMMGINNENGCYLIDTDNCGISIPYSEDLELNFHDLDCGSNNGFFCSCREDGQNEMEEVATNIGWYGNSNKGRMEQCCALQFTEYDVIDSEEGTYENNMYGLPDLEWSSNLCKEFHVEWGPDSGCTQDSIHSKNLANCYWTYPSKHPWPLHCPGNGLDNFCNTGLQPNLGLPTYTSVYEDEFLQNFGWQTQGMSCCGLPGTYEGGTAPIMIESETTNNSGNKNKMVQDDRESTIYRILDKQENRDSTINRILDKQEKNDTKEGIIDRILKKQNGLQ